MAITINCTVSEVSRTVSYNRDSLTVTRILNVRPYSAIGLLAYQMLGGARFINGRIRRILPSRDPWLPQCFCESIESTGGGKFLGAVPAENNANAMLNAQNVYDFGILTVSYKTPEKSTPEEVEAASEEGDDGGSENSEIELASQSWDFSAQALTLPLNFYQFKNGNPTNTAQLTNVNATKTIPKIDYNLMRHRVARRPIQAITALVGRVNKNPFNLGVAVWPAETLRFEGAHIDQKITMDGFKFFDISYKFTIMPIFDFVATSMQTKEMKTTGSGGSGDPFVTKEVVVPSKTAKQFVGWNRIYRPDMGYWDRLVEHGFAPPYRNVYKDDQEITQTGVGKGFNLLFNPKAK